jgi:predicted metal-dependent phosphoesterase TrpH
MKIELHIHTTGFSYCGKLSTAEIVDLYSQAGYDAIVITNHFNSISKRWFLDNGGKDYYKSYFDTIGQAAELGKKCGLLVLGGFELRFDENANDYLVYGMTPEQCLDYEKIFTMTAAEFGAFARENDILFYQAHPFRNGITVVNPEHLLGIEVLNTHPRHDSRNDIALAWAEKYGLHKIAGSDCHQKQDVGSSAIFTDHPVKDMSDLVYVLKNDLYTYGENLKQPCSLS